MELSHISDDIIRDEYSRRFRLHKGDFIRSSEDVVNHLRTYLGNRTDRELFVVMFLNARNQVISTEVMFEGDLTTSAVYPRQVVKRALELNAAAVVIAHNHPSGNVNPSQDDMTLTKKLKTALKTVDIFLHDHIIIVPGNDHTSFSDRGLL
jgi:DNA repair protein RadC